MVLRSLWGHPHTVSGKARNHHPTTVVWKPHTEWNQFDHLPKYPTETFAWFDRTVFSKLHNFLVHRTENHRRAHWLNQPACPWPRTWSSKDLRRTWWSRLTPGSQRPWETTLVERPPSHSTPSSISSQSLVVCLGYYRFLPWVLHKPSPCNPVLGGRLRTRHPCTPWSPMSSQDTTAVVSWSETWSAQPSVEMHIGDPSIPGWHILPWLTSLLNLSVSMWVPTASAWLQTLGAASELVTLPALQLLWTFSPQFVFASLIWASSLSSKYLSLTSTALRLNWLTMKAPKFSTIPCLPRFVSGISRVTSTAASESFQKHSA